MRDKRTLEAMVVSILQVSGGQCPMDLLAIDADEEAWFRDRLKGRHGVKHIGIVRGVPSDIAGLDEVHLADWLQVSPSTRIATTPAPKAKWDEEGY